MKWLPFLLIVLTSCAQRSVVQGLTRDSAEKQVVASVSDLVAENPYPRRFERHVEWEELTESDRDFYAQSLHERGWKPSWPVEKLIRCYSSMSLDGGSHNWVRCHDENGKLLYSLLFRYPDYTLGEGHPNYRPKEECDENATWIFRQTIEGGKLRTAELNQLGARHEMDRLERYLKAFIGEKVYQSYYAGEEAHDPIDWEEKQPSDPFAPVPPPEKISKAEQQRRGEMEVVAANHAATAQLARMIRQFRNLDMLGIKYF